jgi:hypothetical protein
MIEEMGIGVYLSQQMGEDGEGWLPHALAEQPADVSVAVQDRYNLNRFSVRVVDDQVGAHVPKAQGSICQIRSDMPSKWPCCNRSKSAEHLSLYNPRPVRASIVKVVFPDIA